MAACSISILYSWLDRFPDRVGIGAMERVAGELHERSYQRSIRRCRAIKEELMINRWHPRRIGPLTIEAGWGRGRIFEVFEVVFFVMGI
jgi:hypothetical protein